MKNNWSEADENGIIKMPDELDPLFHKVGIQIRFHTISDKNEIQTICDIIAICQQFFKEKELKEENSNLRKAGWKLLQAMGQHQFFSHGYAHGSASISEVMAAGDDEHKAYKELWDLLKQIEGEPVQQHS